MLRERPLAPVREARRLLDAIGWAAVLPQLLAALGALFAAAGFAGVFGMVAVMYALLVIASRFAPETRGRSLEQVNEVAMAEQVEAKQVVAA